MLLVLCVHGAAVWLVWRSLASREPAAVPRWTVVQLLPLPRRAVVERPAPPVARRLNVRPAVAVAAPAPLSPGKPGEPAEAEATGGQSTVGAGAAPAGAPAAVPLVLRPSTEVLRGALANPATQDPRANTPRPSAEERMAMAIDPGLCVRAERLPDGSVRRWMGRLQTKASAIEGRTGHRGLDVAVCE